MFLADLGGAFGVIFGGFPGAVPEGFWYTFGGIWRVFERAYRRRHLFSRCGTPNGADEKN